MNMVAFVGNPFATLPILFFQSEIGFGKIESYTKLDKLGEVSSKAVCLTVNWEIKSKITF